MPYRLVYFLNTKRSSWEVLERKSWYLVHIFQSLFPLTDGIRRMARANRAFSWRLTGRQVTKPEILAMRNAIGFSFLEQRPQVKLRPKEKSHYLDWNPGWALHYKPWWLMPMVKYGSSYVRLLPRGRIGAIAWSGIELTGQAFWGPGDMGSARQGADQPSIWNKSTVTCFPPPWEWLHAGSQHRLPSNPLSPQIASTFLQFGVYWFSPRDLLLSYLTATFAKGSK